MINKIDEHRFMKLFEFIQDYSYLFDYSNKGSSHIYIPRGIDKKFKLVYYKKYSVNKFSIIDEKDENEIFLKNIYTPEIVFSKTTISITNQNEKGSFKDFPDLEKMFFNFFEP
ncbi:hypothetical protein [Cloacibacterium normanense]|uniref:hypothetical protein n=1 Tax=Cloacibacterium normanense TaxID=237258 RepID=UPI0008536DD4|nr:hypothetical protein [Cloacibacterium normanense]AZI69740.1 hypothetical protein EB819_07555 [Cloacibacterium normanense]SDO52691.1 hypothetical protein SAMN04489756_10914 [Cloacibacterium normanense]